MTMNDDRYWQAIQKTVDGAQSPPEDELANAEQLLHEIDQQEGAQPLPKAFVDSVVDEVTAAEADRAPQPARIPNLSTFRRLLATAAALLVTPKFLLAAGAATVITISALVLRNTTTSLPFQDAIAVLMDVRNNETTRQAAQGRIFFDVVESIGILHDVGAEPAMAASAQQSMERIRIALDEDQPFVAMSFSSQHQLLGNQALISNGDPGARLSSVEELTEQVIYGIRALKAIAAAGSPPNLMTQNAAQLTTIRKLANQ